MSTQVCTETNQSAPWMLSFPTADRIRFTAHSVVGRLGFSVIAELAGCWLGVGLVRRAASDVGGYMAPFVFSLFSEENLMMAEIAAMAAVALRVQDIRKQLAIGACLGAVLAATHAAFHQYPNWTKDGVESVGRTIESVAALLGENFGGFIGLSAAGIVFNKSGIVYWDRDRPEECYAVGMVRYQLAGIIYDQIVNPKMMIFKPPCIIGGIAFKTVAYNSNLLIPFLRKWIALIQKKESSKKILEPLIFQMVSRRFFKSASDPIGERRFYLIFSDLIKEIKKVALAHLFSETMSQVGADQLATRLLLRAFKEYVSLVKNNDGIIRAHSEFKSSGGTDLQEDLLKASIQEAVRKNFSLSQAARNKAVDWMFPDDKLEGAAVQLTEEIVRMEKEFLGGNLLTEQNKLYLKKILVIHSKFFINYMCLHFIRLTRSDLEDYEDMELVLELNHLILSGYFSLVLPKPVHTRLNSASRSLSTYVPRLQKKVGVLIHSSEQSSKMESNGMKVDESYCPVPKDNEAEIAHLQNQVARLRAQRDQSVLKNIPSIQIVEGYDITERKIL